MSNDLIFILVTVIGLIVLFTVVFVAASLVMGATFAQASGGGGTRVSYSIGPAVLWGTR